MIKISMHRWLPWVALIILSVGAYFYIKKKFTFKEDVIEPVSQPVTEVFKDSINREFFENKLGVQRIKEENEQLREQIRLLSKQINNNSRKINEYTKKINQKYVPVDVSNDPDSNLHEITRVINSVRIPD